MNKEQIRIEINSAIIEITSGKLGYLNLKHNL